MKRIALVLLLIAGSIQLKAQQLLQVKPDIKLNDGLQNTFKYNDWLSPQKLLLQPLNSGRLTQSKSSNDIIIYSTMPVAKGSSTDRMPIATTRESNVKYTMLIKKVEIVNPLAPVQNQQP